MGSSDGHQVLRGEADLAHFVSGQRRRLRKEFKQTTHSQHPPKETFILFCSLSSPSLVYFELVLYHTVSHYLPLYQHRLKQLGSCIFLNPSRYLKIAIFFVKLAILSI